MDSEEGNQQQIENPAIEKVETKPKPLKIKVMPLPEETKVSIQNISRPRQPIKPAPSAFQPSQPFKREASPFRPSIIGRNPSPAPRNQSIHSDENSEVGKSFEMVSTSYIILPFSKQQTVAMTVLTLALFIKSLETLVALRELPDKLRNEVFYTLMVLLCVSMFLNFCIAAILVRLGIKKDDEQKKTCEPCECCGPCMCKPRYMSSEQLIYMCSVLSFFIFVVELCVAVLHMNVFAKY